MNAARRRRRLRHHAVLATTSSALFAVMWICHEGGTRARLSTSLAYVALVLVGVTLSLGPRNVLTGRPNPVSSDLRRDCGLWSALVAFLHVAVGLTVHFHGQMETYFVFPHDAPQAGQVRWDTFGLANYAGAAAALGLLLLTVLSNDWSVARLGASRWKRWQRSAYTIAGLTVVHGAAYIILERRPAGFVTIFVGLGLVTLLGQLAGRAVARRQGRPGAVHGIGDRASHQQ